MREEGAAEGELYQASPEHAVPWPSHSPEVTALAAVQLTGRLARSSCMTPEACEAKALECLRLIQDCVDPPKIAQLKKLAEKYTTLAEAIRGEETKARARKAVAEGR